VEVERDKLAVRVNEREREEKKRRER